MKHVMLDLETMGNSPLAAIAAIGAIEFDPDAGTLGERFYTTIDLHAEHRLPGDWRLQFKLANLTDRVYETAYGYNQPGRAAHVTLRWQPR